jgi:hypothetical protein
MQTRLSGALILAAGMMARGLAADVTTSLPNVNASNWVIGAQTEVTPIPVKGWEIVATETNAPHGVTIRGKTVTIDGEETPALEITYEPFRPATNSASPRPAIVRLPLKIDAYDNNVFTFLGKVEPAAGSKVLAGREMPRTGWFSYQFNAFMDNFGIALFDNGPVHWARRGVPSTHFLNHVDPGEKRADGWSTFAWDMKNEDHTGNKGFDMERVAWLEFTYDNRGVPDDKKSVITIANPRFVKGMRKNYPDEKLVNAWTNFIESYKPDYSDSSRFLENPQEGRIARPIQIAKGGKALAEIVVTTEGDANRIGNFVKNSDRLLETRLQKGNENLVHANAAAELRLLLGMITGADFPIRETPGAENNVKIFLGASYAKKHFPQDLAKLAEGDCLDGYAIRVKDGDIYIFGAIPKGTLNGIYAFLENNTDVIFPRWSIEELGAVYTPNPDLAVVWADTLDKPRMILRGWLSSARNLVRNKCNFNHVAFDAQAWGGYTEVGGHCFSLSYNSGVPVSESGPYKKFYPLIDGKRPEKWNEYKHQMCFNHPDLYEIYVSHRRNRLNSSSSTLQVLMIGPDDNWGLCECPYCSAPIQTPDGRTLTPKNFNEYYSTQFYLFLQRVADNLAEFRPGFVTSTFAYFFAAPLPAIEVGPNIRPWLCPYVRKDVKSPIFSPVNNHWWQLLKGWRAKSDQVILRDYYGLTLQIHPIAEVLAFDLRAMADAGALRITAENNIDEQAEDLGAAEEAWVISRLMWNPDQDVEQLRKYYLRRTFREAAPAIEKFRGTIRSAWYKERRTVDFDENHEAGLLLRNLGLEKELQGCLDEALKTVKHPQSRILVERLRAAFADYMEAAARELNPAKRKQEPPRDVKIADDWWKSIRGEKTEYTVQSGGRWVRAATVTALQEWPFKFDYTKDDVLRFRMKPSEAARAAGVPLPDILVKTGNRTLPAGAYTDNGDGSFTFACKPWSVLDGTNAFTGLKVVPAPKAFEYDRSVPFVFFDFSVIPAGDVNGLELTPRPKGRSLPPVRPSASFLNASNSNAEAAAIVQALLARDWLTPDQKRQIHVEYARWMPTFGETLRYIETLIRDNNLSYSSQRPGNRPGLLLEACGAILRASPNATRKEADEYIQTVSELTLGRRESLYAAYSAAADSFAGRKSGDEKADKRIAVDYLKQAIALNSSPKNNDAAAARLKELASSLSP